MDGTRLYHIAPKPQNCSWDLLLHQFPNIPAPLPHSTCLSTRNGIPFSATTVPWNIRLPSNALA
uniref:Uncharacterized protein n=1 Tax=Picea glauca TaxID=3330 RepID=A0A101LW91_PICGL|nr:hypothetical protein ABT39_MTgene1596 [Picea glauca]